MSVTVILFCYIYDLFRSSIHKGEVTHELNQQAKKALGDVEVKLHSLLDIGCSAGEWPSPRGRDVGTLSVGDWVGLEAAWTWPSENPPYNC